VSTPTSPSAPTASATPDAVAPAQIKAIPVRHPWRWVLVAIIVLLAGMFAHMLVTNTAFNWRFMAENALSAPVLNGVKNTLFLTVVAMVIGVVLGILLAIMRMSGNPVLSAVAWAYVWFFRAVPRVVLLVLFGNIGILYKRIELGVPFDFWLERQLGFNANLRVWGVESNVIFTAVVAAIIGLALSEAAYMAEIVRAGMLSVAGGQSEAAAALGMSRGKSLRRIVLPQAMRVIVPPTGNETIAMLKDTALVAYVPFYELFFQLTNVGNRTFQPFPMLVAACLWYLAMSSVLMAIQYLIERHYGRGVKAGGMMANARGRGGI
jgi:polar amino acid transport system permease protein